MKRTLLTFLLLGQVALARPLATPFEQECFRLEPLVANFDPACPERLASLGEASQKLGPGPERAYYFWLASLQANQRDDHQGRNRFRQLALAEPGLPPVRLAGWLGVTLSDFSLERSEHNRLLKQLSSLYEAHPCDEILWQLEIAQAESASFSGQSSLARTLRLGALSLAERHRWFNRQLDYWLDTQRPLTPERWEAGFKVAVASRRADLFWRLLSACRRLEQWNKAIKAFPGIPDPSRLEQCFAEVLASHGLEGLNPAQRIQEWSQLVHRAQARGRVEEEISARHFYGRSLCQSGQIKLGLRQAEAALQLRLDHPLKDEDWAPSDRRLSSLALDLVDRAIWYDQLQKAREAAETILNSGWKLRFKEEYRLYGLLFQIARLQGDVPAMNRYWTAQAERAGQWPAFMEGEILSELLFRLPSGQDNTQVVGRLRKWSEQMLSSPESPPALRWNAALYLASALKAQGDTAGVERLWRAELERAREQANQGMQRYSVHALLVLFQEQNRIPEMKSLAYSRLQDSDLNEQERRALLSFLVYALSPKQDPEALGLAEQLVSLSKKLSPQSQELRSAYQAQSIALSALGRDLEALQALDQAGAGSGPLNLARDREGHLLHSDTLDLKRAQLMWKLGRQQESMALLESSLQAQQNSEVPLMGRILKQLTNYRQQRGEDWQSAYARALDLLMNRPGDSPAPAGALEHDWLQALAA
ncbi:MAG: hypothetical protein U0931_37185 [Vulcanimicrobiota bacterium]